MSKKWKKVLDLNKFWEPYREEFYFEAQDNAEFIYDIEEHGVNQEIYKQDKGGEIWKKQ